MMGLRLIDGVCVEDVIARTGLDPRAEHAAQIAQFESLGLLRARNGRLTLTASGLNVSNAVIRAFLPRHTSPTA